MPKERIPRVNALLHQEIDRYLTRSFEPPQGVLLTIESVQTSSDLGQVKVFLSVLPENRAKEVVDALTKLSPHIRHTLTGRLFMKTVPKIVFVHDTREAHADHIYRLLDDSDKTR